MAKVGAQRAAELTGKSKSTIQRAMNNGKLSFEMDSNDRRVIDVSELERVFGLKQESATSSTASVEQELEKATQMLEMERMKMQLKGMEQQLFAAEEQISDLKEQRDKWQKQADQVLITSQYSQKQAEDMRTEIKEREERARQRRQKMMEEKVQKMAVQNDNTAEAEDEANFNFNGLWKRVKGPEVGTLLRTNLEGSQNCEPFLMHCRNNLLY